ncbi:histidine kinase dimerization/phospho-acceptor domain-containing protein [Kitasatospora sp. NPDC001132]
MLRLGVPVAALLVALAAWLATSRALRPVEAIRADLGEIGEHRLDRRVPVPHSRDEISGMARSTNATLDRLERSAIRQQRFVADASHELRSPIAALRTNLEVSLAHPERTDSPAATREALTSVERLQGTDLPDAVPGPPAIRACMFHGWVAAWRGHDPDARGRPGCTEWTATPMGARHRADRGNTGPPVGGCARGCGCAVSPGRCSCGCWSWWCCWSAPR